MSKHSRDDMDTGPRMDDGSQADWSSEGGALPEGRPPTPEEGDRNDPSVPTRLADSALPEERGQTGSTSSAPASV